MQDAVIHTNIDTADIPNSNNKDTNEDDDDNRSNFMHLC